MAVFNCRSVTALVALFFWAAAGSSTAYADWAACRNKPTRSCVIEEALGGDSGPLTGKDRLDVLIEASDAANPLEYATAADIKEAQRLAKELSGDRYRNIAIHGFVAANQVQEAFNLIASSSDMAVRGRAFTYLTRALVKAGQQDRLPALLIQIEGTQPPIDPEPVVVEFVKAMIDAGKIDEAIPEIIDFQRASHTQSGVSAADMLIAVAQAYAKRGDTKRADQLFDEARAAIQTGLQKPPPTNWLHKNDPITLRYQEIALSALRGDSAAVKTALQQLPPDSSTPEDHMVTWTRMQGQARVILALTQKKQFELAIEIAKSMTDSFYRNGELGFIAAQYARDGRFDDARAMLSSFRDETKPKIGAPAVGVLAVALAKAGDISSALQTTDQIGVPTTRRATLFRIAQTLPP
jgi:tetratricopeptide (TPR) repeat protein